MMSRKAHISALRATISADRKLQQWDWGSLENGLCAHCNNLKENNRGTARVTCTYCTEGMSLTDDNHVNAKEQTNGNFDVQISNVNQSNTIADSQEGVGRCKPLTAHVQRLLILALLLAFLVYLGFVLYLNPEESIFLCILTPIVVYVCLNAASGGKLKKLISRLLKRTKKRAKLSIRVALWSRRVATVVVLLGIVVFLVIDIWDNAERWRPLGGLTFFVVISVVFSKHPRQINWITVAWGLILQFIMGLLILRWRPGYKACQWLGAQVTVFLGYTDQGSKFVFGEAYLNHPVVFKILPVCIYFGAIVSVLYYLSVMQTVIKSIAFVLQFALNTTPIESFATAAHIFLGMVETSLALKPFFHLLTLSEIHAIMTSGYATVAGTIIAAYIEFGVPAEHVISASFMSAPAALALAKISIPETEVSMIKSEKEIQIPSGQETNLIEALSVGATQCVKLIAYVVVNLIAFISVLAFLDAIISYLGARVNYPDLSFQLICSYVFMPLATIMGVPWSESKVVGALIGKKIFINELLAYADLGALIKADQLQEKTSVLATYILCGFGSIAALGINIGALSSAAPERRSDFARLSVRSMINGNLACFMTACIAGLLFTPPESVTTATTTLMNATSFNVTSTVTPMIFNVTSTVTSPINVT